MTSMTVTMVVLSFCFVPEDQTAGWKQTPLPKEAPALAAPREVDQFRTDERALVLSAPQFTHTAEEVFGKLSLTFEVPAQAEHLRVRFRGALDGMKVDAVGVDRRGRTMPLMDERRIGGHEVEVAWRGAQLVQVSLRLHHHLRPRPLVSDWSSGHWEVVSAAPDAPGASQRPGMLIWRHPGGRRIELCQLPKQRLELQDWRTKEQP